MSEPVKIKLADKEFDIRPLTIRQIEDISKTAAAGGMGGVGQAIDIVLIALKRGNPDLTREDLLDTELPDMNAAVETILKISGLPTPGELKAAANP